MKSPKKTSNTTQPTPLVSLFAVVTAVLAGVFIYQKFFGTEYLDFGPIMIWLAVAIPTGLFGIVFFHVRANKREKASSQAYAALSELQANPRLAENSRTTTSKPNLDRPLPDKDPFENL
jgi:high-affinity Fe2+/Pb2+ permease